MVATVAVEVFSAIFIFSILKIQKFQPIDQMADTLFRLPHHDVPMGSNVVNNWPPSLDVLFCIPCIPAIPESGNDSLVFAKKLLSLAHVLL